MAVKRWSGSVFGRRIAPSSIRRILPADDYRMNSSVQTDDVSYAWGVLRLRS